MKGKFLIFAWLLAVLTAACTTQTPVTTTPGPVVQAQAIARTPTLAATATPDRYSELDQVIQSAKEKCKAIQPGQACLGQGPVVVEAQPTRKLKAFQTIGDTLNLADLKRLKLGKPGSSEGLVFLSIPADEPGAAITLVAFGDLELVNAVPFGDSEFYPMQSLTFATSPAVESDELPFGGMLIQAPDDGALSTLIINGLEMTFGSTAFFSNIGGSMIVHTMAGMVAVQFPGFIQEMVQGTVFRVNIQDMRDYQNGKKHSHPQQNPNPPADPDPKENGLPKEDPETQAERERLTQFIESLPGNDPRSVALKEFARRLIRMLPTEPKPYEDVHLRSLREALERAEEARKRQKAWKGGWWKMTYGPATISGNCLQGAVGDGAGGGDGQPYTEEIPICRGNNGKTMLLRESGQRFDRVRPNLYVTGWMEELQDFGGGANYNTSGRFQTIQVLSPTRMKLNTISSEAGGCTTTHTVYLDFLRDDPAIRCGRVVDLKPWETPQPTPTEPEIEPTLPPIHEHYAVRVGLIKKDCDPQAKAAAPDFILAGGKATAALDVAQDGGLVMEIGGIRYPLTLGPAFNFFSQRTNMSVWKQGLYALEQPLKDPYQLSMTLMQVTQQQFSGNWQVYNQAGDQYCAGTVDLSVPKK